MSNPVILQFEEIAAQAVLLAEGLKTPSLALGEAALGESVIVSEHLQEVWRWLNSPVSLSELSPQDSGGFTKRR